MLYFSCTPLMLMTALIDPIPATEMSCREEFVEEEAEEKQKGQHFPAEDGRR
jgi:hypothetical protein